MVNKMLNNRFSNKNTAVYKFKCLHCRNKNVQIQKEKYDIVEKIIK